MLKINTLKSFILTLFCSFYFLTGCSDDSNKESKSSDIQSTNINANNDMELSISNSDDNNSIEQQDELIVGTSADHMPFEFMRNGKIVGFDIDLIKAIAKKLNMKIVIKDMQFYLIIPSLKNGDINIAISGISETPERAKVVDFSIPYYSTSFSILNLGNLEPDDPIQKGMKIGVQTGTIMHQWLIKQDINVDVVAMDNNLTLVEELKNKRLDGILMDQITANDIAKSNTETSMTVVDFKDLSATLKSIAVQKGDPILDRINTAINELQASGEFDRMKNEWGL